MIIQAAGGFGRSAPTINHASNGTLHVVWYEVTNANHADLLVRHSLDNGVTWLAPTSGGNLTLGQVESVSGEPSIRSAGSTVAIFWSQVSGDYGVFSSDGGATYSAPALVASGLIQAQIASSTGLVRYFKSGNQIACAVSSNLGVTLGPDRLLTTSANGKQLSQFTVSNFLLNGGALYGVWSEDVGGGNTEVYFRKYPTECQ